jgi:hypothetical protein
MIAIIFRVMGGILLFLGVASVFIGIFTIMRYPQHSALAVSIPVFIVRVITGVLVFAVIGMGLLLLRKWAALAASILALYPAYWCFLAAIHPVDAKAGDANWLGFVFGTLLIAPLILTAKGWRTLVWRGKKSDA